MAELFDKEDPYKIREPDPRMVEAKCRNELLSPPLRPHSLC
jgi:hypothetical protein